MISKRIDGRKDGKSSASDALAYGEGLTPDRETGELLDKSHRTRLGNFGLVDDGVYIGQDMTEMIGLAATEMQANCDMNTRVGEDKKIGHFVVSFNQDKPSEAVLRDTEDSMLAAMKLDTNHFVTFLHNDNGYWHLHIFASRIEKDKLHRGNPLWHDMIKRDTVCREVEIRHGLVRDNGLHVVDDKGQIVEVPKAERIANREAKKSDISDSAKKTEIYSGEKSFQTWAHEIRIGDRLKHAKNWQDLHSAAAAYGCEVRQKSGGFVVCPSGEKGGIQLSKIGLKNLPAKFGAFQESNPDNKTQIESTYKPAPTNAKGAGHYIQWQAAKKDFQPVKTAQINAQRESHKATRTSLRERHKSELKAIREATNGADKLAAVSVAKMQHAVDFATLVDRFAYERQVLHRQLATTGPGYTFRDYLVREAQKGDDDALVLARKYAADETTKVLSEHEAEKLKIKAALSGHEQRSAARMQFTHKVERTGTVIYNFGSGRIVTDSAISKQIQLNDVAASDPNAIATSLRFATSKFGNTLTLTGSQQFQKLAVEIAVRERLGVKFADPALDAYREKLVAELKQSQSRCIVPDLSHLTHKQLTKGVENVLARSFDNGIQPNHILRLKADRRKRELETFATEATSSMHELSASSLDGEGSGTRMLLPGSVPGSLGDSQAGQDHNLRRAGTRTPGSRGLLSRDKNVVDVDLDASPIKSVPQAREQAKRAAAPAEQTVGSTQQLVDQLTAQQAEQTPVASPKIEASQTAEQRQREIILAADPRATFEFADPTNSQKSYTGPIFASSEPNEDPMFIQRGGHSKYVIHLARPPVDAGDHLVKVKYHDGKPIMEVRVSEKGKGRG